MRVSFVVSVIFCIELGQLVEYTTKAGNNQVRILSRDALLNNMQRVELKLGKGLNYSSHRKVTKSRGFLVVYSLTTSRTISPLSLFVCCSLVWRAAKSGMLLQQCFDKK